MLSVYMPALGTGDETDNGHHVFTVIFKIKWSKLGWIMWIRGWAQGMSL